MSKQNLELSAWFRVHFDEKGVYWLVNPPQSEAWTEFIDWGRIIRICFKSADFFLLSDDLYIFTQDRPESYVIPLDAFGALDVWNEIIRRGLFDAKLAIEAASAGEGELFCWPPVE